MSESNTVQVRRRPLWSRRRLRRLLTRLAAFTVGLAMLGALGAVIPSAIRAIADGGTVPMSAKFRTRSSLPSYPDNLMAIGNGNGNALPAGSDGQTTQPETGTGPMGSGASDASDSGAPEGILVQGEPGQDDYAGLVFPSPTGGGDAGTEPGTPGAPGQGASDGQGSGPLALGGGGTTGPGSASPGGATPAAESGPGNENGSAEGGDGSPSEPGTDPASSPSTSPDTPSDAPSSGEGGDIADSEGGSVGGGEGPPNFNPDDPGTGPGHDPGSGPGTDDGPSGFPPGGGGPPVVDGGGAPSGSDPAGPSAPPWSPPSWPGPVAGSPGGPGGSPAGPPPAGPVIADGGELGGSDPIEGPVVVEPGGTISPGNSPGTLPIIGDLTLDGLLLIEIAGTGEGEFDQLKVSGTVSAMDPLIQFSFIDGFLPAVGDIFAFMFALDGLDEVLDEATFYATGLPDDMGLQVQLGGPLLADNGDVLFNETLELLITDLSGSQNIDRGPAPTAQPNASVPAPTTLWLLLAGAPWLVARRRRGPVRA